jgi:hypothetical protein
MTENEMKVGQRVRLTRTINDYPVGIIPAGSTGRVSDLGVGKHGITRNVLFDKKFESLAEWGNRLYVTTGQTSWGPKDFEPAGGRLRDIAQSAVAAVKAKVHGVTATQAQRDAARAKSQPATPQASGAREASVKRHQASA